MLTRSTDPLPAAHDRVYRALRGKIMHGELEPGTALTSNGFLRFQLLRDTGAKTPVVRVRKSEVFDRNTGETFEIGARP